MLPGQIDFDAVLNGRIKEETLDAVRKLSEEWDGSCKEIRLLRAELLKAQGRRCFYCRRNIAANEVGLREMDHILPKSQSPTRKFDKAVASSNKFEFRRHTRGYPKFTYEPKNLVVCCKRCNSFKGTFDPLRDRSSDINSYPAVGSDFLWIHPFYDKYIDHIEILGGGIYVKKDGSDKGDAVIRACGLDKSEELTKKLIADYVNSNLELAQSMLSLVILGPFDMVELSKSYAETYGIADAVTMERCLTELMSSVVTGFGAFGRAADNIQLWLGTGEPIYATGLNSTT
jgi:5-methylcytosine-specific restriction endonuclease McrA